MKTRPKSGQNPPHRPQNEPNAGPTHLSVFGLQPQLVPADGLDVSGLGQDLDAFGGLHQQGAGRGLQPGNIQGQC